MTLSSRIWQAIVPQMTCRLKCNTLHSTVIGGMLADDDEYLSSAVSVSTQLQLLLRRIMALMHILAYSGLLDTVLQYCDGL